jgi:phosphate transport system permease protein
MANPSAPEKNRSAGSVTQGNAGDVWADRIFRGLALVAGLAVLAILALIAISTTRQAWPRSRPRASPSSPPTIGFRTRTSSALAFIYGTLYTALIAIVIAVPVSLGIALFTTEMASRRLQKPTIS